MKRRGRCTKFNDRFNYKNQKVNEGFKEGSKKSKRESPRRDGVIPNKVVLRKERVMRAHFRGEQWAVARYARCFYFPGGLANQWGGCPSRSRYLPTYNHTLRNTPKNPLATFSVFCLNFVDSCSLNFKINLVSIFNDNFQLSSSPGN